jgi:hypothetical protein
VKCVCWLLVGCCGFSATFAAVVTYDSHCATSVRAPHVDSSTNVLLRLSRASTSSAPSVRAANLLPARALASATTARCVVTACCSLRSLKLAHSLYLAVALQRGVCLWLRCLRCVLLRMGIHQSDATLCPALLFCARSLAATPTRRSRCSVRIANPARRNPRAANPAASPVRRGENRGRKYVFPDLMHSKSLISFRADPCFVWLCCGSMDADAETNIACRQCAAGDRSIAVFFIALQRSKLALLFLCVSGRFSDETGTKTCLPVSSICLLTLCSPAVAR